MNMVFWIIFIIVIVIIIEILIGYAIGTSVSKETGVVLGVILIILGVSIFIGILVIVFSRNNKKTVDVNININSPQDNIRNIIPNNSFNYLDKSENGQKYLSLNQYTNDNKKCPFCAEIIKREAIVCRFCGRDIPKEKTVDIEIQTEDTNNTSSVEEKKTVDIEIQTEDTNNTSSVEEKKKIEIEQLEKLFDLATDENEKGIIAKKLYDLGKMYYWRFIPR